VQKSSRTPPTDEGLQDADNGAVPSQAVNFISHCRDLNFRDFDGIGYLHGCCEKFVWVPATVVALFVICHVLNILALDIDKWIRLNARGRHHQALTRKD
jgi:hypothetical protein